MTGIGTDRIGLDTYKDRAQWDGDKDKAVRISTRTGQVTTAEHGFFSRSVRRLFGPSKQDIADNQRLIGDFAKDLRNAFGPEIAAAALLRARADMRSADGAIHYDAAKPLTTREIQTAIQFAQSEAAGPRQDRFEQAVGSQILHYGPGGAGFAKAAQAKGVDAATLGDGQRVYVLERLEEEVARRVKYDGEIPDSREIRSMAGKLARRAQEMGPEGIQQVERSTQVMRGHAQNLLDAMTGREAVDPFPLLADLLRASGELVRSYAVDPSELGTDDRVKPALLALDHAVAGLSPEQARTALVALQHPDGGGFRAMVALELAADAVSGTDAARIEATGEINQLLGALCTALSTRAESPDADRTIARAVRQAARQGEDAHGAEVQALAGSATRLIDDRGRVIAEHQRIALLEEAERPGGDA